MQVAAHPLLSSVLARIRARRAQEAKFVRSRAERRLGRFLNRSRIWLASLGMHSQTAAILATWAIDA